MAKGQEMIDISGNTYGFLKVICFSHNRNKDTGKFEREGSWGYMIKNEFINANFIDDKEKMNDFEILSKEEFLSSYSYLTEEEYNNTKMLYGRRSKINNEQTTGWGQIIWFFFDTK